MCVVIFIGVPAKVYMTGQKGLETGCDMHTAVSGLQSAIQPYTKYYIGWTQLQHNTYFRNNINTIFLILHNILSLTIDCHLTSVATPTLPYCVVCRLVYDSQLLTTSVVLTSSGESQDVQDQKVQKEYHRSHGDSDATPETQEEHPG